MKCPNCHINDARYDQYWGYLPCEDCWNKSEELKGPSNQIEFTSDSIKKQRKEFAKDIVQPHRKGQLSKEWLDINGPQKAKNYGFSDTEIKKAKNVWHGKGGTDYYKE